MKSKVVYLGNYVDWKYSNIVDKLDVEYIPLNLVGILKFLLSKSKRKGLYHLHLRYLIDYGYIKSFVLYVGLILLAKIFGLKVVWSCHNIYEHNNWSKQYNDLIRKTIFWLSDDVIVFHKSLIKYLPPKGCYKTHVACFGDYSAFLRGKVNERNYVFQQAYQKWCANRGIKGPDIVFIGDYKKAKGVDALLRFSKMYSSINILIVAKGISEERSVPNVLTFGQSRVFFELHEILSSSRVVGFVAHSNLSVPTAIHLYSSYGVPVIAANVDPLIDIVADSQIGVTFKNVECLVESYNEVFNEYEFYREKSQAFNKEYTWEKSAKVHNSIFQL